MIAPWRRSYEAIRSLDLFTVSAAGVAIESVSPLDPGTGREAVVVRSLSPMGAGRMVNEFLNLRVRF